MILVNILYVTTHDLWIEYMVTSIHKALEARFPLGSSLSFLLALNVGAPVPLISDGII